MPKNKSPRPPRRPSFARTDPNRPLSPRAAAKLHKVPKDHYGDPEMRPADKPSSNGGLRMGGRPVLYGDGQNGTVVGVHSMNKPPKGSDGCTVKTLDYRTFSSPERDGKGDKF